MLHSNLRRSLTALLSAAAMAAMAGCDGTQEANLPSEHDTDGDGQVTPADIENSSVSLYTEGSLDDADAACEIAVAGVSQAVTLAVAEEMSLAMLEGIPELPPDLGDRTCWDADRMDSSTVEIDFDGCADHGIAGLVTVTFDGEGHASLELDDDTFAVDGHDVDGTLQMDRESLHPLQMSIYTADDDPLGVFMADDARRAEVAIGGTLIISRSDDAATLVAHGSTDVWDNADDDEADDDEIFMASNAFVIGGDSAETMGDDPLTWNLPFDDCYRPSAGTIVSESRLEIDEVTVDLDEYIITDRDRYLPAEFTVSDVLFDGDLVVQYTGACGDADACFHANDIEATIPLDKENVVETVAAICEDWDRDCDEALWLLEMFLPDTIYVDVEDQDFCDLI